MKNFSDADKKGAVKVIKFLVKQAFAGNDVIRARYSLWSCLSIVEEFKLPKEIRTWVVGEYCGSQPFFSSLYAEIYSFIKLGNVSKDAKESFLARLIKWGWEESSSNFARDFLKRNLTENEMKKIVAVYANSASMTGDEDRQLILVAQKNNLGHLADFIKEQIKKKRERFSND